LTALGAAARRFVEDFRAKYHETPVGLAAIVAAQAAEIALDAIGRSDGTRLSVVEQLHAEHVVDGPLGTFGFDGNGDPTRTPFSIYRYPADASPQGVLYRVVLAPPQLAAPIP
jgi:ABC-type branched-subunit amino acid transport system substrate-binding protein